MPTFYEGAPIAENTFLISREDFIKAYFEKNNDRNFFCKREVKGGVFLTLILLTLLTIPAFLKSYGSFFVPTILIILFLLLFYYFVFWHPGELRKEAAKIYETNSFLKLETKAFLYRDSLIYENQYERYTHYLTDFSACMEDKDSFLFIGGKRNLLIVKKDGMDNQSIQKLHDHLSSFFTSNYILIKQGFK